MHRRNADSLLTGQKGCLSILVLPPALVLGISLVLIFLLSSLPLNLESDPEIPAQPFSKKIAPMFTPEIHYWGKKINQWAKAHGLDPNLVATVMQIESCGDPQAVSSAGAKGLFQVMPFHFKEGEDPFDPPTNAKRGLAYLALSLKNHGGDTRLALAGYNGGISRSLKVETSWPAETQRYVYWGWDIYQDALAGKQTSDRLEEWLSKGGSRLCEQAAQRLELAP